MDLMRKIRARVDSMISRAVINRVNEALKVQRLQVTILADETVDDVDHLQGYGTSFNPPAGSEALVLNVNGSTGHPVAICAHDPGSRPTDAAEGCGGLYTGNAEWRLYIDADGVVHLGAKSGAEFVALADKVKGELDAIKTDIDNLKTAVGSHTHPVPGVTAGPASTTSSTPTWTAPTAHTPGSVAATKVKAT